jgi:hypothetical protein
MQTAKTRNAIYYFYDSVDRNDKGETGQPGDKHYKCLHGNRGVFTVTKASRYNLACTFTFFYKIIIVTYYDDPLQHS